MSGAERKANFRQVAINIVVSVAGVSLLHDRPLLCAAVMALLFLHITRLWLTRRDFCVAGVGLVAGAMLEFVATGAGLWKYAHVTVGNVPAWIFSLWPVFMIGLPRLAETVLAGPSRESETPTNGAIGLLILAVEIPLLALWGNERPWLLTILTAVALAAVVALQKSRLILYMAIIAAGCGAMAELLPVYVGAWSYPKGVFFGLPPWIPTGYALFGLGVVNLGFGIEAMLRRRKVASWSERLVVRGAVK